MPRAPDAAYPGEVHEFVVLSFLPGVSHLEQLDAMRRLDAIVRRIDGFRAREYFFSAEEERWVDHIVWADVSAAEASERVADDPVALALFRRMSSVVSARYRRMNQD
jgi:hypothetical protein